jgi:dihydroxyacid dehydratase/phosphogluconate dehydratase
MYNKSTQIIKAAEHGILPDTNAINIGIINAAKCPAADELINNILIAIKANSGVANVFNIVNFGYIKSIIAETAKFAPDFQKVIANYTKYIIGSSFCDCIVVVTDCDITAAGVLIGCIKANCPVLIMPVGTNPNYNKTILSLAGSLATRKIRNTDIAEFINNTAATYGIVCPEFYTVAECLGLTAAGASKILYGSNKAKELAAKTGEFAVARAKQIINVKNLINKKNLPDMLNAAVCAGATPDSIFKYKKVFELLDIKLPHNFLFNEKQLNGIVLVKGSAAQFGGHIKITPNTPASFNGSAWVYNTLQLADEALTSGAIDSGVIVVRNCVGVDVSLLAYTIISMEKQKEIAVATDGYCCGSEILAITNISPDGNENEEFANIQTGDVLEIDIAKGRFNTSVSAKDMKIRGKRNIIKKQEVFFGN